MTAPEADGPSPAAGGASAALPVGGVRRAVHALGRRNVAYLCGVLAVVATVPVLNAIERASGTLEPDRLGGEVGSVILWAAGSLVYFGVNALNVLGWLIDRARRGAPVFRAPVSHAVIGCALPPATLLIAYVGAGLHDAAVEWMRAPTTHVLTAPKEVGGIVFPAGSTIVAEAAPSSRVVRGHLGAATTVGGLTLVGDFTMSPDGLVGEGELAAASVVEAVPCGPGRFRRRSGYVECTLAEPASIDGWACAPGPVEAEQGRTNCILAHDQDVGGFWLMGGTRAVIHGQRGGSTVPGGGATLARPLDVFGVTLPRGTRMFDVSDAGPDDLREGRLPEHREASFHTPEDAVIQLLGGEVRGRLLLSFRNDKIGVGTALVTDTGTFVLDGRPALGATFDRATGTRRVPER